MQRELRRAPAAVVALGPLTDVACLVQNDPVEAGRISRRVAVMGRRPGEAFAIHGRTGLTDFNFRLDPRAVSIILDRSRIPVTFMTFSLTSSTFIPASRLVGLKREGPTGRYLLRAARPWIAFWRSLFHEDGFHPWDQNAVYRAMTSRGCRCVGAGYRIVQCTPNGATCAGHGPSQPSSLDAETAQLWLDRSYRTRRVTACLGYTSAAERRRFLDAAVALLGSRRR